MTAINRINPPASPSAQAEGISLPTDDLRDLKWLADRWGRHQKTVRQWLGEGGHLSGRVKIINLGPRTDRVRVSEVLSVESENEV